MEEGFQKADSHNLPHVDVVMVSDFLVTCNDLNQPQTRGVKTIQSIKLPVILSLFNQPCPDMRFWEYMEIAITLCVGGCIVGGLLLCYACVFRQLCCPPRPRKNRQDDPCKPSPESISLKYMTHVSSQPTDTSQV